jgi:POLQ-like helicase
MSGRAGRAGIDEYGESFLMLSKKYKENEKGLKLVQDVLEDTESQLSQVGIQRLVLDFVSCGVNLEDFKEISELTLFHHQHLDSSFVNKFTEEFYFLVEKNFIQKRKETNSQIESQNSQLDSQNTNGENSQQLLIDSQKDTKPKFPYETTPFGLATFKSSFSMSEAVFVSQELVKCQERGIILSDELHMCYLLTPIGIQTEPNWNILSNIYNMLSPARNAIATSIGVSNKLLIQKSMNRGRSVSTNKEEEEKEMIAKRFFYALILCDLVNEKGIWEVEERYQINRGVLQSLMQSSGIFAGMMIKFCERMGWNLLHSILAQYSKRLEFGIKSDALELIEIEGIGPVRARLLINAGFKDPMLLAKAKPSKIVSKLNTKLGPNPKRTAEKIVENAKKFLQKKASIIKHQLSELENYQ